MLLPFFKPGCVEAGTDEAGRGCLAGDVFAAAVVLPDGYENPTLNDSKQLSEKVRYRLREEIISSAVAWGVGRCSCEEIDRINILNASILAMHRAIGEVQRRLSLAGHAPLGHIIVDGNRFKPYGGVPFTAIVKGDAKYLSIAAASVLAKTFRDDDMLAKHEEYPFYGWDKNKGYPTAVHRRAIEVHGASPHHRRSFRLLDPQLALEF